MGREPKTMDTVDERFLVYTALLVLCTTIGSFLGPAAAGLLSGSFVVERIFRVPGLGSEFVDAAFNRDYTMIMGTVLFFATMILIFNLLVDIAQAWLDPRLRHEH